MNVNDLRDLAPGDLPGGGLDAARCPLCRWVLIPMSYRGYYDWHCPCTAPDLAQKPKPYVPKKKPWWEDYPE